MIYDNRVANPLKQHVNDLLKLHNLIAGGKGDESVADEVRDNLEVTWRKLADHQRQLVEGLSADLYALSRPAGSEEVPQSEVVDPVVSAMKENNWELAITLIRQHEKEIPAAIASFWRGICWSEFGLLDVAIAFFIDSVRRYPDVPVFWILLLDALISDGREEDALRFAEECIVRTLDPLLLFKAAGVLFINAESANPLVGKELHRRAIEIAERGIQLSTESGISGKLGDEFASAYLHIAMSYANLGDIKKANEASQRAWMINPNNLKAMMVRGFLDQYSGQQSEETRIAVARALVGRSSPRFLDDSISATNFPHPITAVPTFIQN